MSTPSAKETGTSPAEGVSRTGALTLGSVIAGIFAAPCAMMVILTPLGIASVVPAAGGMWFDHNRNWFIGLSLGLMLLTLVVYWQVRKARATLSQRMGLSLPFSPWNLLLVAIAVLLPIALIVLELVKDNRF